MVPEEAELHLSISSTAAIVRNLLKKKKKMSNSNSTTMTSSTSVDGVNSPVDMSSVAADLSPAVKIHHSR